MVCMLEFLTLSALEIRKFMRLFMGVYSKKKRQTTYKCAISEGHR